MRSFLSTYCDAPVAWWPKRQRAGVAVYVRGIHVLVFQFNSFSEW